MSIVSNNIRLNVNASLTNGPRISQTGYAISGDFYIEIPWNRVAAGGGSGTDERPLRFHVYVGGTLCRVIKVESNGVWEGLIGGSSATLAGSSAIYSGTVRVRRSGGTVYCDANTGGGWVNIISGAVGGNFTNIDIFNNDLGSDGLITDFGALIMTDDGTDGSGNPLIVFDPTGESCP
jgi:hypothetical protein